MTELGTRLKQARQAAGIKTAAEAARKLRMHPQNVRDQEAGRRGLKPEAAATYAKAYGVSLEWLLTGKEKDTTNHLPKNALPLTSLPVVGTVEAGAWREVPEVDIEPDEHIPVVPDPRYPGLEQFALKVSGESMNLEYPDGSYVICIEAINTELRTGAHVIVEAIKPDGTREATIKELVIKGNKRELWPRSSDPRYQKPVIMNGTPQGIDYQITGVVVGDYKRRG